MAEPAAPPKPPAVLAKPLPILLGALAGLGVAVLLQQYAVTPLTLPFLLLMLALGAAVIGVGLPTLLLHLRKPKSAEPEVRE